MTTLRPLWVFFRWRNVQVELKIWEQCVHVLFCWFAPEQKVDPLSMKFTDEQINSRLAHVKFWILTFLTTHFARTWKYHLRFINKDLLRSGRLPNVPDADEGATVKTNSAGHSCRLVDWNHGVPLDLREVHQADLATCKFTKIKNGETH